MNLLSFATSALGGSLFGGVMHIATSAFDVWRKGKEVEQNIRLMDAQTASAEKIEAWKAFTASQATLGAIEIPEKAHPIMVNLYLGVDAFTRACRPLLTWVGLIYIAAVYYTGDAALRASMAPEINFSAWTMVAWWFGVRYQKK
jgi:hypothetical protein